MTRSIVITLMYKQIRLEDVNRVPLRPPGDLHKDRKMNSTLPNSTTNQAWVRCFSSLLVVIIQNLSFSVGLPLNIYIVLLIISGGLDGSVVFTLSHALNDVFFILPAPFYLLCHIQKLCVMPLLLYVCASSLTSRFLIQCGVSLECYLAVLHPVTFRRYKHLRYRLACSLVIWSFSLIVSAAYVYCIDSLPHYILALVQTAFCFIKTFCCISTLKALRRPGPGTRDGEDVEVCAIKKRVFGTVCLNLVSFLIQMLPLTVAFFLYNTLPVFTLVLALSVSFYIYASVGLVQTVFFLYQLGKLAPLCQP